MPGLEMVATSFDAQRAISIIVNTQVHNTFPLNCMDSPLKEKEDPLQEKDP